MVRSSIERQLVVLVLCVISIPLAASADLVTIGPVKDNTLYEPFEDKSNGAGDYFFAGRIDGAEVRRGVIAFDPALIAALLVVAASFALWRERARRTA